MLINASLFHFLSTWRFELFYSMNNLCWFFKFRMVKHVHCIRHTYIRRHADPTVDGGKEWQGKWSMQMLRNIFIFHWALRILHWAFGYGYWYVKLPHDIVIKINTNDGDHFIVYQIKIDHTIPNEYNIINMYTNRSYSWIKVYCSTSDTRKLTHTHTHTC